LAEAFALFSSCFLEWLCPLFCVLAFSKGKDLDKSSAFFLAIPTVVFFAVMLVIFGDMVQGATASTLAFLESSLFVNVLFFLAFVFRWPEGRKPIPLEQQHSIGILISVIVVCYTPQLKPLETNLPE